jgi:hypothetical protein
MQRLVTELLLVDNKLQDCDLSQLGSVSYYQDGTAAPAALPENLVVRVADASNAVSVTTLTASQAILAVFQIPVNFAQGFRKNVGAGESLAIPTVFQGGLVSAPLTIEVPVKSNAGGHFSGWKISFHYDYDGIAWVPAAAGDPRSQVIKRSRKTKSYSAAGDFHIDVDLKDSLLQAVVLLYGSDRWSKATVRLNGTTIKEITPDRAFQSLLDHGMNAAAMSANMIPLIFDINDAVGTALDLQSTDTLEIVVTLTTVTAGKQAVILTEYLGLAD